MLLNRLNDGVTQVFRRVPLRTVLVILFILQILGTVRLVGYFSFRNGQQTVNALSGQLQRGITNRIEEKLRSYTEVPHTINSFNAIALMQGGINIERGEGAYQFWQQTKLVPSTNLIYCGSDRGGEVLGVGRLAGENSLMIWMSNAATDNHPNIYSLDDQGHRSQLVKKDFKKLDARLRPWYEAAIAAGQPVWSEIYLDFTTGLPKITASIPIYNKTDRKLRGVCATDFFLPQEMNRFLRSLEIGKNGTAFIMERSGRLVSTSVKQPDGANGHNATERLNAIASDDPTVRATSQYLLKHFDDFKQIRASQLLDFRMDGKQQFIQVLPFQDSRGLDWLIVTVLPEADFMEQIQANDYVTLWLCLVALALGVAINILMARWITRPIVPLSESATALAREEWHNTVEIDRSGDLEKLATSFNHMAEQLQTSFTRLQSLNRDLSQNENRLKQFLEAIPVGIAVLDAAGQPYYVNQRGIQLLGKDVISPIPIESLSDVYQLYVADTDRQYAVEELPIVRALKGEYATAENMEIHQNGKVIPIESWGTPVFDEEGNVAYAIAAFQDISHRRHAEQILVHYNRTLEQQVTHRTAALQASEEKFASAFRASPIAMGILTLVDGKYIDVNNSFCLAMGYDREQVIGRSCLDLNLWKYPEEFTKVFEIIEENRSIRDQEVAFCQRSGDTLMIRISGEVINLGKMPCILLTYEDVTERKQAEEALRRQEQQLRLITDALPVCICYVDPDKRYRFVNQTYEDWFGWRRDEILGKHYREVLGEAVYQVIKPHSNRTLAGAVTTYEAEMPYLLGKKYISATLIPDIDDRGQVKGYYGLVSDIGDRKRAEAASVLEERNRMAREIHDTLAQALTSIIIHLEAASLKLATDVESAQALIQTGRDLARSGLAEARRSVEALRPLILENCDLYSALQKFAEQMFSCTESQVICHRFGHPYPLESSVENNVFRIGQEALHNVLKHAEAIEVKMELVYERSYLTLRITDNGQGFVVDHNAARQFGLLGMTERAERMGASFTIQSVLNQGTTITLSVDRRNVP